MRKLATVRHFSQEAREGWGLSWLVDLVADTRYAFRSLKRGPAFAIITMLILTLGIGANTAVFSVINGVLLRPLPYYRANDLYLLWEKSEQGGARLASYPTFRDWRDQSNVFQSLSYMRVGPVYLKGTDGRELLGSAAVSNGFLPTLGVRPSLGRTFSQEEEERGDHVTVLTYELWQQRFGGRREVLGTTLDLGRGVFTVVGVLPKGVRYPDWTDLYLPLASIIGSDTALTQRGLHVDSRVVARLKPGIAVTRAREDLAGIAKLLASTYPKEYAGWTDVWITPLRDEVLGFGKNWKVLLQVFQVAVAFVLLMACVNLANLTLARAVARSRELAVRIALGAGRGRVMRQLLTESLLLALLSAVLGAVLAIGAVHMLTHAPPEGLPRVEEIAVSFPVLVATAGVAGLSAVLVGLAPAVRAASLEVLPLLREGEERGGISPGRARVRSALVVGQIAVALVLLVGTGLMLRSFDQLSHINPGFNPENVITLDVFPPPRYTDPASAVQLYRRLAEAVAPLPGVQTAALSNHVPLSGSSYPSRVELPGRRTVPGEDVPVLFRTISAAYFTAMQIPLVKGRPFVESDMTATASVVIVNQAFVRKYWPSVDPIGQYVTLFKSAQTRADFGQSFTVSVVGVVANVRHLGLETDPSPEVYIPYTVNPWGHMVLVIRTTADPRAMLNVLRRTVLAVDPDIPVGGSSASSGFTTMRQFMSHYLAARRFSLTLLGSFAVCGLLLAAVGVYGVTSYTVTQRTREMGVRTALGAQMGDVVRLVLRQSMGRALLGVAVGVGTAVALTRLIRSLLYGVKSTDALTFISVTLLLVMVALIATYFPARRAARIDPAAALRHE